ncbi:MAG: NAD(P)/FAD-dependent oxidoreductase [Candidatus Lokiarchaeia archaeon]
MEENINSYDYDIIIIGAGMGGLGAGNILIKSGYSVLIIEKHFKPGGYCTNFKRKDYIFDCSLHMLNGCEKGGMIYNILKKFEAENCVEFIKLKELFHWKCPQKDMDLIVAPDIEDFIEQLIKLFPHETRNIRKFYKKYHKVYNFMISWLNKGFFGKVFTWFRYFFSFIRFMKILNKTVSEILDPCIKDPICKNLITMLGGFFGLAPDEMSASIFIAGIFSYYLEGAYYPKGGSGFFSQALADIYIKNGGTLLLSNEVIRINFSGNLCSGITCIDKGGKTNSYSSKTIIANCDVTNLVTEICPKNAFPQKYYEKIVNRIPGFSAVCIYIGLNLDLNERGFKDYELWISNTIEDQTTDELREIAKTLDFSKFPSTAITLYSNIDSTCCPKGKTVLSSIYYALPYSFLKEIEKDGGERGENYKKLKSKIGENFIKKLEGMLNIPDLDKYIEVLEIATPITLNRYTSNRNGSFIGWEMTPDQMMLNQISQKTPIPNLFLTGAWTMPAGGVSTVLNSGDTCSALVDKYLKKKIKKS